jgi:hypothetical protein
MRYEDEDIDASDLRVLTLAGICRLGPGLMHVDVEQTPISLIHVEIKLARAAHPP